MLSVLMLRSLVFDTVYIGCWCSAYWLLILYALMLTMNALTLMVSSMLLTLCALDADTWRFAYKHWRLCMLMFCALAVATLRIDVETECTDVNFEFIGCWRFVYCLKMLCTLILMLFAIAAVTACIGCWLMLKSLIFDWFIFHYWAGSVLNHAVYSGIL